jgi:hypothetical protein
MPADYARRLLVSQEARAERGFCDTDPMKRSLGRFAPSGTGCAVHLHDRIERNRLTVTTVVGALPVWSLIPRCIFSFPVASQGHSREIAQVRAVTA